MPFVLFRKKQSASNNALKFNEEVIIYYIIYIYYKVYLYLGSGDARLRAADSAWQDGPGLVVPRQDLGHATVRHAQLSADVARPNNTPEFIYNYYIIHAIYIYIYNKFPDSNAITFAFACQTVTRTYL